MKIDSFKKNDFLKLKWDIMLDESFLNLQITFLLTLGTIIFIFVSFRRRDLITYLPPYLILPIGYLFIYKFMIPPTDY